MISIIGGSILNGIGERSLPNRYFKVRVKNHPGATTKDICDHLKLEIQKKPEVVITHAGTNDLISNTKLLENYERVTDSVGSKVPNCKLAISTVVATKDRIKSTKKMENFNIRLSKFCKMNKIDIIDNKNLVASYLNYKQLHLNKKG